MVGKETRVVESFESLMSTRWLKFENGLARQRQRVPPTRKADPVTALVVLTG